MRGWKQGYMFLAGKESRDCFDFISDVGIRGFYLSLAPGTANFKQLDLSCSFGKTRVSVKQIILSYSKMDSIYCHCFSFDKLNEAL